MVFITRDNLEKKIREARDEGHKAGRDNSRRKIKELEIKEVELRDKLELADAELKVLRGRKDKHEEAIKTKIEADDLFAQLNTRKELLDKKEKDLEKRAENINSEEEANYVKGYADGIADGLRKVHEMTEKDRENLAKIAMVSAASHTTVETMKEVNSEFRLTEGSKNPKTK